MCTNRTIAVFWAAAMIAMAVGNYFGLIEDAAATTMLIVLPLLAFTTLQARGKQDCARGGGTA